MLTLQNNAEERAVGGNTVGGNPAAPAKLDVDEGNIRSGMRSKFGLKGRATATSRFRQRAHADGAEPDVSFRGAVVIDGRMAAN